MKIVIIGAGAMGCLYGAYLSEHNEVVIFFVKSTFTEEALEANKELFVENTVVMTLQNGAGNDRRIAGYWKVSGRSASMRQMAIPPCTRTV